MCVFNGCRFLTCNHDIYAVLDTEVCCAFATAQALEDACMATSVHLAACSNACTPSTWAMCTGSKTVAWPNTAMTVIEAGHFDSSRATLKWAHAKKYPTSSHLHIRKYLGTCMSEILASLQDGASRAMGTTSQPARSSSGRAVLASAATTTTTCDCQLTPSSQGMANQAPRVPGQCIAVVLTSVGARAAARLPAL